MITITRITTDDPLYTQAVDLRTRVLLAPIGYDIDRYKTEFPGVEERYEHFVAVLDHPGGDRVVGNACLLPHYPEDGSGKLSQMAVDPQRQNEGIGTKLVVEMERRATTHHDLDTLMCHAQIPAVPFYEHLGWERDGEMFQEAGIDHYRMHYALPKPPEGL